MNEPESLERALIKGSPLMDVKGSPLIMGSGLASLDTKGHAPLRQSGVTSLLPIKRGHIAYEEQHYNMVGGGGAPHQFRGLMARRKVSHSKFHAP